MNIFEQATRKNFKFQSSVGELNVINLWDLPLTSTRGANLNDVAKEINSQLKAEHEESFVIISKNAKKAELESKLEVVKYIISVKLKENADRVEAAEKAKRREQLIDLLAKKKDQELESKSIAEIEAELQALS